MAGFDNPRETWIKRFAREDFLFGEEPNAFLRAQAHRLKASGSVLCVADGEGRNSVWLAEQGFTVTAFDFAPNAVAKAKRLAARQGVRVSHGIGDMYEWPWAAARYDALVAIFIQFLPPEERDDVFAGMQSAVMPGGLFLLEGYRPEQVDYATGGPPRRDHMYTREWLQRVFSSWEIFALDAYDAVIAEGQAHRGMSALIDLVARKPA
ncbi:MAG TPA: class I SAM-dependent methyltransferase [Casimicrobiaceae bacterium]